MKPGGASLIYPVPTLSEAVEIAVPHMRAIAAPLAARDLEPDTLVEMFIENLLFGAVWFRPPFRPIDMADAFLEDLLANFATCLVRPANGASECMTFEAYAAYIRRTFWEDPG